MQFPFDVLLTAYEPLDRLPAIRPLGLDEPLLVVLTPLLLGQGIDRFVRRDFSVLAPGFVRRVLARTVPLTPLPIVGHALVCGCLPPVPMKAHKY